MTGKSIAAIIVAAGTGSRSGQTVAKQFARLGGRPVLGYSHAALTAHPLIDPVLVVIGAGQDDLAKEALAPLDPDPWLVTGGKTRRDSVRAALEALDTGAKRPDFVLIHDAARPFIPADLIDRLISALDQAEGVIPALPVADTLVQEQGGIMGPAADREALRRVQTPQAFRFETILRAHRDCATDIQATDDAGLLRAIGRPVALVDGDIMLEKLTYPADFARAEALLGTRRVARTGMGFDVHRLVAGKPLWLCGIEIPHDRGLSGHSDADVAIHALVDALLGALADGDIGSHFPPSAPRWKGAPSHLFLTFARDRAVIKGATISHVDLTIICESPKIGPHRDAMRRRIAELLRIDVERVSVKATTTERLGFTGRGEGIAAQAVATVMATEDL